MQRGTLGYRLPPGAPGTTDTVTSWNRSQPSGEVTVTVYSVVSVGEATGSGMLGSESQLMGCQS